MREFKVGGVPEHFNWPWHLALADNAFAAAGSPVRYQDYPGGTGAMIEALRTRAIDMALLLTEGALAGALNGEAFKLVKVYVSSPLTWGIHVAGHSDITSMRQAPGRRIAISRYGSGSHLIAIVDALNRGQPINQLQFVLVDNLAGARRALAANDADLFLWERFTTNPLVLSGEFRRIDQCVVPWPAFVVAVRNELLPTQSGAIRCVLEIVHRYARRLKGRRGAVAEIAKAYALEHSDAEQWFNAVRWSGSFRPTRGALRTCMAALQRTDVLEPQTVKPADVWHAL